MCRSLSLVGEGTSTRAAWFYRALSHNFGPCGCVEGAILALATAIPLAMVTMPE